jgi:hypothetical protein
MISVARLTTSGSFACFAGVLIPHPVTIVLAIIGKGAGPTAFGPLRRRRTEPISLYAGDARCPQMHVARLGGLREGTQREGRMPRLAGADLRGRGESFSDATLRSIELSQPGA